MSDDSTEGTPPNVGAMPAVLKLTGQDVAAFLQATNARSDCYSCGQNDWRIFLPSDGGLAPMTLHHKDDRDPNGFTEHFLPAILMACNNCGLLRSHSAFKIAAWVNEKGQKS